VERAGARRPSETVGSNIGLSVDKEVCEGYGDASSTITPAVQFLLFFSSDFPSFVTLLGVGSFTSCGLEGLNQPSD
jgi:hypothetical protein